MLLFYDTETTGLWDRNHPIGHPNQPKICQLSSLLVTYSGTVVNTLDLIVKPDGWTIPEEASNVHGISQGIADEKGMPLLEALRLFNDDVKHAKRLIGHNESFDSKVVQNALKMVKRTIPLPEARSCTMMMAKDVMKLPPKKAGGDYSWPSLTKTYEFLFGKTFDGAHNSLADTKACMEVYQELKRRGVDDVLPVKDRPVRSASWNDNRSYSRFKDIIESAAAFTGLSDWEQGFITDLVDRAEKYGDKTFVTDKQWSILERIEHKMIHGDDRR